MKLRELAESCENVKIGTPADGFIYCGDIKKIDYNAIDIKNVIKIATYISNCKVMIERNTSKLNNPEEEYEKYISLKADKKRLTYDKWIHKLERDLKTKKKGVVNGAENLINYISISDREVIETYPSIMENSTIVIIEGNEVGDAWTTEEYERSK